MPTDFYCFISTFLWEPMIYRKLISWYLIKRHLLTFHVHKYIVVGHYGNFQILFSRYLIKKISADFYCIIDRKWLSWYLIKRHFLTVERNLFSWYFFTASKWCCGFRYLSLGRYGNWQNLNLAAWYPSQKIHADFLSSINTLNMGSTQWLVEYELDDTFIMNKNSAHL